MIEFREFAKISRMRRMCTITEKINGINVAVIIDENGNIGTQTRTQLITTQNDHHNFAAWVEDNKDELLKLGPGHHFGEWWGYGIPKGYSQYTKEKHFSLFNTGRWTKENIPACCEIVPVLYNGIFNTAEITYHLEKLRVTGSVACPGAKAEGIVVYHHAANIYFKITLDKDEEWKGKNSQE